MAQPTPMSQVMYTNTDGVLLDANGKRVSAGRGVQWKDNFLAKLLASAAAPCSIALVGDSLTQGCFCSDVENTSWAAILRSKLQALYGDGGSGFKPSVDTVLANVGNFNAWITGQPASSLYALTGSWNNNTGVNDGPGANNLRLESTGGTVTFTGRGTAFDIFFISGVSGFATFTVSVDGGAESAVQNTQTGANGVFTYSASGLAPGNHTVRVTCGTAAPGNPKLYFCGMRFRNTTGVRIDRYARQGWPSAAFNNGTAQAWRTEGGASNGTYAPAGKWSGGSLNQADFIIYSLGLNDANITSPGTIDPTTYLNNVRGYLEDLREGNPSASVLLLAQHRGALAWENSSQFYTQYMEKLNSLSASYKCGFLNIWAQGNNSWSWMKDASRLYMGANAAGGIAGTDQVHLSDAGHAWVADQVLNFILPN